MSRTRFLGSFAAAGVALAMMSMSATAEVAVPAKGASPIIDKILANGKLRAGVIVAPPNLLQDPSSGNYFGPSIDIANKLGEVIGVPVELVETSWDVAVAGLQADKFDINIAPLFATAKRKEVVDFVNYAQEGMCYFARKDDDRLKTVADINQEGIRLLVQTGTSPAETAKTDFPKATVMSKPQPPGGGQFYEDILTNRADAAPVESSFAKVTVRAQRDLKIIPPVDECLANPPNPSDIGIAFNKGDPVFTEFLQAIVDEMRPQLKAETLKYSEPEYLQPN
jgi:polar amino acid transport system substrate-binding protein